MGFSGNKFFYCVSGIVRRKKKKRMMCNGESALMFMKKEVLNPRLFLSFHRLKVVVMVIMEEDNILMKCIPEFPTLLMLSDLASKYSLTPSEIVSIQTRHCLQKLRHDVNNKDISL
ncbi:hypothetical protein H5410_024147 [Solanum commersonii]|uniref:Uncharacterized protein n=1 Tax=Solanum commersonii TaxID=4109 RepID=A0A9J5ZL53_SOLCO|nr:hypothetical protein H5410_024147 [Solanum commersonii]